MIEIRNVSKWYRDFQVLKDCSLSVTRGEVVVVCGPSGSGKSTLIKCVNGLEPIQDGDILVDRLSVRNSSRGSSPAVTCWDGISELRAVPAPDREGERLSSADCGPETSSSRRRSRSDDSAGSGRFGGSRAKIPLAIVWRPTTTRCHRACSRNGPYRDAVRRANIGARSRNDFGSLRRHDRPGPRRHDHDRSYS